MDKLDYFRRDAFYLGVKGIYIEHDLLMKESRVIKDLICYPSKYALHVNDIFQSRFKLFRSCYLNNCSKGVELMIVDIFRYVEPIFEFKKTCRLICTHKDYVAKYLKFTDSILEKVADLRPMDYEEPLKTNVKKAQTLMKELAQRKIYKFAREIQVRLTEKILREDEEENS